MLAKTKIEKTCGNCRHTQNDLGVVALHCDLIIKRQQEEKEEYCDGKVRSWEECEFHPSMRKRRIGRPTNAKQTILTFTLEGKNK